MSKILTVTFDGSVLKPDTPLQLEPNKRIITLIAEETKSHTASSDAWDVLKDLAGTVEAPQDWASEHEYYLYGTPIRI